MLGVPVTAIQLKTEEIQIAAYGPYYSAPGASGMADNWSPVAVFSSLSISLANVIGGRYDLEIVFFCNTFDDVYASRSAFMTHTE
jgi:hypothetical protein